jgi:hypothetical protein
MDDLSGSRPGGDPWPIDELPFQDLDRDEVHDDRQLFYMLAAASFVEITSDLYTGNLMTFYRGDDEVTAWLSQQWEPEELHHGAALKRYVETAWPEFDWNAGYRGFLAEYSGCCAVNLLAATQALELAARCVVETGTATFYRALSEMTAEPVLKQIAANISVDEVRHYKHFYRFFQRYHAREGTSRLAILRTLWQRATEVDVEDAFLAFKHVFLASNPGAEFQPADYDAFRARVRHLAKRHFPYDMAVRMMLKPLELSPPVVRVIAPPIISAARFLFLR